MIFLFIITILYEFVNFSALERCKNWVIHKPKMTKYISPQSTSFTEIYSVRLAFVSCYSVVILTLLTISFQPECLIIGLLLLLFKQSYKCHRMNDFN